MNIEAVNDFIGADWVYKDNDCWTVVRKASYKVFGVNIHEIEIPEQSNPEINTELFERNTIKSEWIKREKPLPGMVAIFINRRNRPIHIGLCITKKDILHCFGTVKNPGKTVLDSLSMLNKVYPKIEYYEYDPGNRNK